MSSSPAEFSIAPAQARDPFRDRRPPYSEDAEQAVLGAMLLDADAIVRALEMVDESMFYSERHRRIFHAMYTITQAGSVVDPLTLSEQLERNGLLQGAGGKDYIGVLLYVVPTAANIEYHLKIVKEYALRRRLIEVAQGLVQEAHESPADASELMDLAEHRIFQVSQQRGSDGFTRIKELLWPAMEKIESLREGGMLTGVPSGFKDLDTLTLGFQPSDLVIIAARPSMGKTAFVLNIAQHAAVECNLPTAIFSLEMSKDSLVQRMLASEGYIDAQRLRNGKLTSQDHSNLAKAAALLGQAPIWIDDTPGLTLLEIRSRARRLKSSADIKMVIVDYLQLVQGPPGVESRQQEISQISRSLKILAKELNVPVVALSQLSRASEQRVDKRPQLSDLRESGAIEQDADVVMFIYRQEMYDRPVDETGKVVTTPDGTPIEGLAEVIIGKQRNGPTGFARLNFRKQFTRFENFTARQPG
jgi:replicative DNA helicase